MSLHKVIQRRVGSWKKIDLLVRLQTGVNNNNSDNSICIHKPELICRQINKELSNFHCRRSLKIFFCRELHTKYNEYRTAHAVVNTEQKQPDRVGQYVSSLNVFFFVSCGQKLVTSSFILSRTHLYVWPHLVMFGLCPQ